MQLSNALAHPAGLLSREHWLSLLDQGVVSGFLSTLLIANSTNSVELGFYALGLSVLISVVGFQEALILQPYTIHRLHSGISPTEHAGASLILSLLFSAVNIFVLVTAALVLDHLAGAETVAVTWVLAAVIPLRSCAISLAALILRIWKPHASCSWIPLLRWYSSPHWVYWQQTDECPP